MEIHTRYTEEGTLYGSKLLQVVDHLLHDRNRDGKSIASERTSLAVEHGVDTNQLTPCIDERTTRVTLVDGGISLDEGLDSILRSAHLASLGTDDTCCDGGSEVERVSDGQYPLSHFQCV